MSYKVIGKSVRQRDTVGKVTGRTIYAEDRSYPDQVWASILFARRPHARVLAVDSTEAEAVPGVLGVLTARDVPVNEYGQQKNDQPVLCGPGSPSAKPGEDVVRFVGDQVAVVLAEDEETAARARDLIRVSYEDLPLVTDPEYAMTEAAYQLHPDSPRNIFEEVHIRKGEPDSAWQDCDVVVDSVYRLPFQEHVYIQPESGVGYIDEDGRITIHTAGQWAWEDRREIAHALSIPLDKVRVVYDAIGGAFGGKEDLHVQIVLALAIHWLDQRGIRRPVKCVWTREESIIGHCKRHPMVIRSKWGAKADGRLVVAEIELISDGGAYVSTSNKVLRNASITATGPYEFPHASLDAYAVYTNNLFSGAFRGFGATQGAVVAEMQMNKLAAALQMDPIELRHLNALTDESLLTVGTSIPGGISVDVVMDRTAGAAGWKPWSRSRAESYPDGKLPRLATGRGFAVGFKNVGFSYDYNDNAWAAVELRGGAEIEEVIVHVDGADLGQGHHTAIPQIAAEVLGVDLDKVRPIVTDTSTVKQSTGCAAASRLTFMGGNAVVKAAQLALEKWQAEERPASAEAVWTAPVTSNFDPQNGFCTPNFAYGYAAQLVDIVLDTETGVISVEDAYCADDVGQAINPELVIGQIEGAMTQAHGYVVMEDFRMEDGYVKTPDMSTYLIPGIRDIPQQFHTMIVEEPHPKGPFGVRGVGEIPFLPYAPALIAAVYDATGIWFDEFPLTPERILRGIGKIR